MIAGLLARLVGLEHVVQLTINFETVVLPVAVVVVRFVGKFIVGVALAVLLAAIVACIALVTFIITVVILAIITSVLRTERIIRGVVRSINCFVVGQHGNRVYRVVGQHGGRVVRVVGQHGNRVYRVVGQLGNRVYIVVGQHAWVIRNWHGVGADRLIWVDKVAATIDWMDIIAISSDLAIIGDDFAARVDRLRIYDE